MDVWVPLLIFTYFSIRSEVTTVKTADSISIELNKVTRDILEKYKDTPFKDNKRP